MLSHVVGKTKGKFAVYIIAVLSLLSLLYYSETFSSARYLKTVPPLL